MVKIQYVITDELGIHARPAGRLVRQAKEFESVVQIGTPEKMVDAKKVMGVMTLGLKQGDTLTMSFEGTDEEAAAKQLKIFLEENM